MNIIPPERKNHASEDKARDDLLQNLNKSHQSWNEKRILKCLFHTGFGFFSISQCFFTMKLVWGYLAVFMRLAYFLETLLLTCMHQK